MMTATLRAFAAYLLPLLLAGCLSASVTSDAAEVEPVPQLEIIYAAKLFYESIDFLAFSEDGSTFSAGGVYDGVGLYWSSDYSQRGRYYERDITNRHCCNGHGMPTAEVTGVGYIDENTWYFSAIDHSEATDFYRTNIHIRSIQPPREIAQYSFPGSQRVAVNSRYVAFSGLIEQFNHAILVNWRTGEKTPADVIPSLNIYSGHEEHFELTRSNRVLSSAVYADAPNTVLADPFNHKTEKLDWYVTLSPDERHAIDFSERRCKLRKFSGKAVAPIQKQEIAGYCSARLSRKADEMHNKWVSFSPDGKSFVVAMDRDARVYRIEPFQLALEIRMPGQVVEAALSDDGWLAVSDRDDYFRLWDVATGNLAGQHHGTSLHLLRFRPGANQLMAASGGGITVFALPERTGR